MADKIQAYSEKDSNTLDAIEQIRVKLIGMSTENEKDFKELLINPESMAMVSDLMKSVTNDIHKKTNTNARVQSENASLETDEDRLAFMQELHSSKVEAFQLSNQKGEIVVPDEFIPEMVPGQTLIGIEKPTYKEIMATKIDDGEDDEDDI